MIETQRLLLRPWREADLQPFHAMCSDPAVMRYLGPLQSRDEVATAIARQQRFQAERGYCFWVVELKEEGQFLGFCGLKPGAEKTPIEHDVEIGWRLRADSWGKGYAREAAEASLAWAWAELDTPVIAAITNIENTRSWGLMERLGMTRNPAEDFDHATLAEDDPLRRHIIYRIDRPQ
jgi:RimJ/RimL family protein N-acetyltransferase